VQLNKGLIMRGRTKILIAALVVVAAGYTLFKDDITQLWDNLHVKIAEYPQPKKTAWLNQGVSKEDLRWFYHADQGTRTFGIPYEWFLALEKPDIPWLIFTDAGPFNDTAYLDRYGFIPDTILPDRKDEKQMPIDAGSVRRAVAQPEQQKGHARHRPDLRGLSYRTVHL
jgi:hypothetical protein